MFATLAATEYRFMSPLNLWDDPCLLTREMLASEVCTISTKGLISVFDDVFRNSHPRLIELFSWNNMLLLAVAEIIYLSCFTVGKLI